MAEPDSIEKLRELELRCWEGELGSLGEWVAECLGEYFAHAPRGLTMERAFGIASRRGEHSWRRREGLAKRDAALRAYAETYLSELSTESQVGHLLALGRRHVAESWRGPDKEDDDRAALLRLALEAGRMPGKRQLRRILAAAVDM